MAGQPKKKIPKKPTKSLAKDNPNKHNVRVLAQKIKERQARINKALKK